MKEDIKLNTWLKSKYGVIYKVIEKGNSDGISNIIKYLDNSVGTCTNGLIETSTNWKPKYKEWCYFFNKTNGQISYRLSQFNHIALGKGREGMFKDMQGNFYDSSIPFGASLECLVQELGLDLDINNKLQDAKDITKKTFIKILQL